MPKEKVTIHIDDREPVEVIEAASIHEEVEDWYVKRLEVGDILVEEADVIFERKTPSDYNSSLINGRLGEQIENMVHHSDNCYILMEGNMDDVNHFARSDISGKAIRGSIASNLVRRGVPTIPCSNIDDLVDMAIRIGRKHIEEPGTSHIQATKVDNEEPSAKKMIRQIENLGDETAQVVYDEYSSIEELLSAEEEDLTKLEGIGEERAKKIFYSLR